MSWTSMTAWSTRAQSSSLSPSSASSSAPSQSILSRSIRSTLYKVERIDLLKIDCEGAEEEALLGLSEEDWARVDQAVIEVHDIDGRLNRIEVLLRDHGLTELTIEKEEALEKTLLSNIYAHRPRD